MSIILCEIHVYFILILYVKYLMQADDEKIKSIDERLGALEQTLAACEVRFLSYFYF